MFLSTRTLFWTLTFLAVGCTAGCTYDVNEPQGICDIQTPVSFAGDILPLLDVHCNGCHAGGSPSGGLNLTAHEGAAESSLEGSLIERLRLPADNIKMMPLNGTPLPECDIVLFESWVADGAPNN